MTREPEVGDLVHLNGGSPPLTITSLDGAGLGVHVTWFDVKLKVRTAIFPTACLKELPDEAL
jgi:uncharacterized protein YodC (DUF2158 family)